MVKASRMLKNITLGADPELFLKSASTGNFVSAVGKIGGSKEKPRWLFEPELTGAAVQEDNVAVEFNIKPAHNREEFISSIRNVLGYLKGFTEAQQLKLAIEASAYFPEKELQSKEALTFGCDPDYNAWLRNENIVPQLEGEDALLRVAGGHLHVGYTDPDTETSLELIRLLDIFLGCPSILQDKDTTRRKLYGKAGAFRFKPYGVEYRTLSNFWIADAEKMNWVYDQTHKAISYYNAGGTVIFDRDWPLVSACINNADTKALETLSKYYAF